MGPDRVRLGLGWRKTPDPVQEVLLPFKRDGWFETPVWGSESADDAQPNPLSFFLPLFHVYCFSFLIFVLLF
jgi:hypothetical protein